MILTANTELLTMLMTSLARDADALGSIKVEAEVYFIISFVLFADLLYISCHFLPSISVKSRGVSSFEPALLCTVA